MAAFRGLTATITLSFQLLLTGFGALITCVDQPHRHGGVAAPDCVMHHQPSHSPDAPAATAGHHHGAPHDGAPHDTASNTASDTPRISCRCSSDPMSFLVGEAATLPDTVQAPFQPASPALVTFARTSIDFTVAPASPPPRLFPA